LLLRNTPVPRTPKPAAQQALDTRRLLHGGSGETWLDRLGRSSALLGRLAQLFPSRPAADIRLRERLRPYLELFEVLLAHIRESLHASGAGLTVVLLPGRSLVERPGSDAAAYQDVLRRALLAAHAADTDLIDLTPPLREGAKDATGPLYYPHDGHLTVLGHRLVARVLEAKRR